MDTSYLTQQVTTIIGQLHNHFDEIGVPSHERDSRESELFSSLSETLHNQLRLVANEKHELVEEAQRIITTIKQMESSLEDPKNQNYDNHSNDLKVTYPLLDCVQVLKNRHKTVSKLHQERYEQVKKLIQALESYSSHLEPSFLKVKLPPVSADGTIPPSFNLSPSYIDSVDNEFTRVYEEYQRRAGVVQQLSEEVVMLWAELGTPQAQTDSAIVKYYRDSPEQLGLHQDDMKTLQARRDKLQDEKKAREKRVKELRCTIEELWERLGIDEQERRAFNAKTRGCGLRVINDLEDELSKLNELKRQNLGLFVEEARTRLQGLWDELYMSEEEAIEFTPMFCDVYSDALLSAHEAEIQRLETLKEQRAPTLQLISKYRSLVKDRDELAASSQDGSRLIVKKGEKRDPTRLLREEKMRKRIAKELPKVEQDLTKHLSRWEDDYGRPFLVFGERFIDVIEESTTKAGPPARSKTPNGMPPPPSKKSAAAAPNTAQSTQKPAVSGKDGSALRSKTPVNGTISRNPPPSASKTTSVANKSPSRIPARVPLGPHGGNSPERAGTQTRMQQPNGAGTIRGKPDPRMMAPPPKMRDLHSAAPPSSASQASGHAYPDDVYRSGSVVRNVMPEDPYSDHQHHYQYQQSYMQSSTHSYDRPPPPGLNHPHQHPAHNYTQMPPPSQRPQYNSNRSYDNTDTASTATYSSRQISADSSRSNGTSNTTVSGSENWETYGGDDSDHERDAGARYYAKIKAAGEKRGHYETSPNAANKKLKAFMGSGKVGERTEMIDAEGNPVRTVEGSEAGWTDEDVY